MGGRAAIPMVLREFEKRQVRATWATVGFVFAHSREEILEHAPRIVPQYATTDASPYALLEKGLGANEGEDPLHFGASLVEQIAQTPGQEIATHSFSHFCCLEPDHTPAAFAADLAAAHSIANAKGVKLRSLVFARNQMSEAHIAIAAQQGIECFRGNPDTFAYRPRSADENTLFVRAARLVDSVMPFGPRLDHQGPAHSGGILNVPASRFLRPYNAKMPILSRLQLLRILNEMEAAARDGRIYHLWWHPHNFGRQTDQNLNSLIQILDHFLYLQGQYGMKSSSMADLAGEI